MIYYDLLYSQTICSDNNAAAECLTHLDMSFCLQFLEGLGDVLEVKRTTKPSNGHVSYCYTAQATLIVVLFLWTNQTKHEPQIVALSMIDPTSMNHVDSVLPYIEFGL